MKAILHPVNILTTGLAIKSAVKKAAKREQLARIDIRAECRSINACVSSSYGNHK